MKKIAVAVMLLVAFVSPLLGDCRSNKGIKFDPVYLDACGKSTSTRPVPKFDPVYVDATTPPVQMDSPTPLDYVRFVWLRYVRGLDVTLTGAQLWNGR